jgi:hypothetical protein
LDKLECVTCEKEDAKALLRESYDQLARLKDLVLATNSKNSQHIIENDEKEDAEALLRESYDQLSRLNEQVLATNYKNSQLVIENDGDLLVVVRITQGDYVSLLLPL